MLIRNRALILATNPTAVAAAVTWDTALFSGTGELDASITLSNGNLTATSASTGDRGDSATTGKTTGKWYFEALTGSSFSGGDSCVGFLKSRSSHANMGSAGTLGLAYFIGGTCWNGASLGDATISGGSAYGANQVIGCAVDLDNNRVWVTKNGTNWSKAGAPASGTNSFAGGWTIGDTVKPAFVFGANAISLTGRFTAASFTLTIPSGFTAWG